MWSMSLEPHPGQSSPVGPVCLCHFPGQCLSLLAVSRELLPGPGGTAGLGTESSVGGPRDEAHGWGAGGAVGLGTAETAFFLGICVFCCLAAVSTGPSVRMRARG